MDKAQFDDILKDLNLLKNTTTKLGESIPKMTEYIYKTLSPEHQQKYLEAAKSMGVEETMKEVAERIKQMNKPKK